MTTAPKHNPRTRTRLRPRVRPVHRTPTVLQPTTAAIPEPAEMPIHKALAAAIREMPSITRSGYNEDSGYRCITLDEVVAAVRQVAARHGVYWLPAVLEYHQVDRDSYTHTTVKMRYKIVGPAGDHEVAEFIAQGSDQADKSPVIAEQAALKYLLSQVIQITADEIVDGDAFSPRVPNVRDIKAQGNQRADAQPRHPAARQRPDGRQQRDTGQGAPRIPAQRGPSAPAGPVVTAPNAKAIADRLVRAASAPNADAVIPIPEEAQRANAPTQEITAIYEIGRTKRAAERDAAAGSAKADHTSRDDEHQGDAPGEDSAGTTGRPVPTVDAPEQSPQAAARIKAMQFFEECSQGAGYASPADAARMFKARYGRTLEEAEIHEIEEFAHGMAPDGEPYGEDGTGSDETDE